LTVNARPAALAVFAADVAIAVATQSAFKEDSAGGVRVAMVPELVSVPHPEDGVRLHVTPAFVGSFVSVAVRVTGGLPAFIVVVEPPWAMATLTTGTIGATENVIAADFVPSVAEVAVTVALQLLLRLIGGV
jgi:hypothetical protein